MRVAVIGAGIAGVTTAYELTADGHAVTVLERHSSVAAEGSFAPTGLTGAGWWALAPQAEGTRPSLGAALLRAPGLWPWWWKQRRSDVPTAAVRRLAAIIPLAQQGHERLQALIVRLGVELEQSRGTLMLWRDAFEHSRAQHTLTALRALGVVATELDTAGCHALEPHLDTQHALAGGIHLPGTDSVNCRQFAHALREAAEQAGADFRFATTVRAIVPEAGGGVTLRLEQTAPTTGFGSSRMVPTRLARPVPPERARAAARYLEPLSDERYDAVVVAACAAASRLLEPLGLHLAMATVHGYTLTAALRSPERGPRSAVVDVAEGAVIGRLGQRVRIADIKRPQGWEAKRARRLACCRCAALNCSSSSTRRSASRSSCSSNRERSTTAAAPACTQACDAGEGERTAMRSGHAVCPQPLHHLVVDVHAEGDARMEGGLRHDEEHEQVVASTQKLCWVDRKLCWVGSVDRCDPVACQPVRLWQQGQDVGCATSNCIAAAAWHGVASSHPLSCAAAQAAETVPGS